MLLSGYYFPSVRADVALGSWPAVPVLGDILRYTISPLLGRLTVPMVYRKLFAPSPVAERFASEFPLELAVRPSQIRASAAETALMILHGRRAWPGTILNYRSRSRLWQGSATRLWTATPKPGGWVRNCRKASPSRLPPSSWTWPGQPSRVTGRR